MPDGNDDTQRWEYALKLSESNNEQIGKLTENLQALTEESKRQQRELQRFRAAMTAALQAYLSAGDGPTDTNE
jgi:hypothetical protein